MKVVLFCGGFGMRLYPTTEHIPKPMVPIGDRPILWHIMKYYSYFGHKDFLLCLGYKGEQIKRYFLNYDECLSSDFVLSNGGRTKEVLGKDIDDWKITFVDTGLNSNCGRRLKDVQKYVENEEVFLANYSDGVTDLHLPTLINFFTQSKKIACVLSVKPFYSYHSLSTRSDGLVTEILPLANSNVRINGGYFVFKNTIFDYIEPGEDLVNKPFQRLIAKQELLAYEYNGFWRNMDTYKDKEQLDKLASTGKAYWQVWNPPKVGAVCNNA
jgi:glucose-1-phosphate cytidylyltransferase